MHDPGEPNRLETAAHTRRADVVVIGGGAAGLMCAIEAGKRGRSAVVLERNAQVGNKIRISGGGRANFTNRSVGAGNYLSENPHFAKSALARYTPHDFVAMVERHGIPYHEKKLGQMFCDRSAEDIVRMLVSEVRGPIVEDCRVTSVERTDPETRSDQTRFRVTTNRGIFDARSVVIATGGISIPKIGATDFGYRLARQFGHSVTSTRPGLVGLVLDDDAFAPFRRLGGVSVDALVETEGPAGRARFRENILFTHRGLSGPAVLQISSYWVSGQSLRVDLTPDGAPLPRRLRDTWNALYAPPRHRSQWSQADAERFDHRIHHWELYPTRTEGYGKAEVTVGGVDTRELSSKTMESAHVPGLYFVGEVVDVTGHLGGFNFQWAWASGYAAGQAV